MNSYEEFLIEQQISKEIDDLFESVTEFDFSDVSEDLKDIKDNVVDALTTKRGKIKKALKTWGNAKKELVKIDYVTKKKMDDPNSDAKTDQKIKASGDKKKEALNDTIKTAEDEMTALATSDKLQTKVDLGKIKYRKQIDKEKMKYADELGDNAAKDAAAEDAKEIAQKEKELAKKNAEYDKKQKFDDDINSAQVQVEKLEKALENESDENKKLDLKLQIVDAKIAKAELESKKAIANGQDATKFKEQVTELKDEKNRIQNKLEKRKENNNNQQTT